MKPRRFGDVLASCAVRAAKTEPGLQSLANDARLNIPQRTIRRRFPTDAAPPIARMLGVGRGGADVRVRLYLWLWAVVGARNFNELTYRRTTGEWAVLLNLLPDHHQHHDRLRQQAARRVSTAIAYLESERLVGVPGRGALRLLDPSGSGNDFQPWSDAELVDRAGRRADLERFFGDRTDFRRSEDLWEDDPLALPAAIWMNGTVSSFSAAALAVLLVLWDHEVSPLEPVHVPKTRRSQYGITPATWSRGISELREFGCVRAKKGALLFRANANSQVDTDRHLLTWRIDHRRLEGRRRERW